MPFQLPKSTAPQPAHLFRKCGKCNEQRPPEGGISTSSDRWLCAKCWGREVQRKMKP